MFKRKASQNVYGFDPIKPEASATVLLGAILVADIIFRAVGKEFRSVCPGHR